MSLGRIKIIILMGIVCIGSCTGPRYLKSVSTGPEEITGTCDMFLYGHRYADDFKNVAFLIPSGGKYAFELYAPEFDYHVRKGLSAGTARKRPSSSSDFIIPSSARNGTRYLIKRGM